MLKLSIAMEYGFQKIDSVWIRNPGTEAKFHLLCIGDETV